MERQQTQPPPYAGQPKGAPALEEPEYFRIGPAARLLYAQADSSGTITYQIENRPAASIALGIAAARSFHAVFDHLTWVALFQPPATRLTYLGLMSLPMPVLYPTGDLWGSSIIAGVVKHNAADPLKNPYLEKIIQPHPDGQPCMGLRICLNVHCRDLLSDACLTASMPGQVNMLDIYFECPSGQFLEAVLVVLNAKTQRIMRKQLLGDFPFVWPNSPMLDAWGNHAGPKALTEAEVRAERMQELRKIFTERRRWEKWAQEGKKTAAAKRPSAARNFQATREKMPPRPAAPWQGPDEELLKAIAAEPDPKTQWNWIADGLESRIPARTYLLFARFPDLIAENARHWPHEKLLSLIGFLPGSILAPALADWPLPLCVALAEANSEKRRFMEILREREVERLMAMDAMGPVTGSESARQWLNVAPRTPPAQVRQIWRRLLGFLNSDYGRHSEKAMHRKKDEIAKRLQQARDLLLKDP